MSGLDRTRERLVELSGALAEIAVEQERRAAMSETERIAICQHPNGEGVWWALRADDDGSSCIQDCECTPRVYVPAVGPGRTDADA